MTSLNTLLNFIHLIFGSICNVTQTSDAIHVLAKAFGCSHSQICRFAMAEWLSDNFVKRLEFAQALQEVKEAQDDSGQT